MCRNRITVVALIGLKTINAQKQNNETCVTRQ